MTDLTSVEQVRTLQTHLRTVFDSVQGKEAMNFLEELCGWYDFNESNPDLILIKHGKRQVVATIKTLLKYSADEIVAIKDKELDNVYG